LTFLALLRFPLFLSFVFFNIVFFRLVFRPRGQPSLHLVDSNLTSRSAILVLSQGPLTASGNVVFLPVTQCFLCQTSQLKLLSKLEYSATKPILFHIVYD